MTARRPSRRAAHRATTTTRARFDLAAAQAAATIRISRSCVERANQTLLADDTAARRRIRQLFLSLCTDDFAHVEPMHPQGSPVVYGDVYGKRVEEVVWFIKIQYDGTTVIMSCHEAERDLHLANGKCLRRKTP